MSNQKLTEIITTSPVTSLDPADILYVVTNVAGTPESSAITVANALKGYTRSATEIANSIFPVDYDRDPGHIERYQKNTTPGTTDMSAGLATAILGQPSGGRVFGEPGETYDFGTIAGDAVHTTVSKDLRIDFGSSAIEISGTDGAFTGCTFLKILDCRADVRIGSFEDKTFVLGTSTSRGVNPVWIANALQNSKGHYLWFGQIISAQSFFVSTTTDITKRASEIHLDGPCHSLSSYYGVVLANNGDGFRGNYSADAYNRIFFAYGVDGKKYPVFCYGGSGAQATSAPVNIYNDTAGTVTENMNVTVVLEEIEGPVRIHSNENDGTLRNIDLDLTIKAYGANLPSTSNPIIGLGSTNTGTGSFETTGNVTLENIKIDFKSDTIPTNPIVAMTDSPNYGVLEVTGIPPILPSAVKGFTIKQGAHYTKGVLGETLGGVIASITQANPAVVEVTGHGIADGTRAVIPDGDMTELNGVLLTTANATANTFELVGIDSTAYTAYTTGGNVHVAIGMELDLITSAENNALKGYAVDVTARSDTTGNTEAIEDWRVHTVTNGSGVLSLKGQNKLSLSQVGAGTPVGAFIAGAGSDMYTYMTGYTTTNGGLAVTYRQVW